MSAYTAFHAAQAAYLEAPSRVTAAAYVDAFSAWAFEYIDDPVACSEEIEALRRTMAAAHPEPQAERIVPRFA